MLAFVSARQDLYTSEETAIVRRIVESGGTAKSAGRAVGRTKSSVISKCAREGIQFKKRNNATGKKKSDKTNNLPGGKSDLKLLFESFDENPETAIPLLETRDHHCRWPLLNGLSCGAQNYLEHSYCPSHRAVAHATPTPAPRINEPQGVPFHAPGISQPAA